MKSAARLSAWVLAAALQTALPAGAETLTNVSQLKPGTRMFGYLFSAERIAELHPVGVFWDRKLRLQQACKGQFRVKPVSMILANTIHLPQDRPHPVKGVWMLRFGFERCGETKIYNALFTAKNGAQPEVRPYFPGVTNASPQLVHDAMQGARSMASIKLIKQGGARDCKDLQLIDMRVTRPLSGSWQETWTFQACGTVLDIALTFTPDGKGGARYSATEN